MFNIFARKKNAPLFELATELTPAAQALLEKRCAEFAAVRQEFQDAMKPFEGGPANLEGLNDAGNLWHRQGCPTTTSVTVMKPLKLSRHEGLATMVLQ